MIFHEVSILVGVPKTKIQILMIFNGIFHIYTPSFWEVLGHLQMATDNRSWLCFKLTSFGFTFHDMFLYVPVNDWLKVLKCLGKKCLIYFWFSECMGCTLNLPTSDHSSQKSRILRIIGSPSGPLAGLKSPALDLSYPKNRFLQNEGYPLLI